MRGNPGFSFSNNRVKCEKVLAKDVGLDPPGSFYKEALLYKGEPELVKLYDEKEGLLPDTLSIALRFASMDSSDEAAILEFFSTYGPLCAQSAFPTEHNLYIYEEMSRDAEIRNRLPHKTPYIRDQVLACVSPYFFCEL